MSLGKKAGRLTTFSWIWLLDTEMLSEACPGTRRDTGEGGQLRVTLTPSSSSLQSQTTHFSDKEPEAPDQVSESGTQATFSVLCWLPTCRWLTPSPGPYSSPYWNLCVGLTVGCVAWGASRVLEDDRHQGLADGCLPAPCRLSTLPVGAPGGPAWRLAHEVGDVGCDDFEAVWVGPRGHEAEVLGGLHREDLGQWDLLVGDGEWRG